MKTAQTSLVTPLDGHNATLVRNVHPPDWRAPTPADRYNLVVIGAGTAGLVTAAGAAGLGARVALVEGYLLGGDCLMPRADGPRPEPSGPGGRTGGARAAGPRKTASVPVMWRPRPSPDCTGNVGIVRGPHGEPAECACVGGTISTCFNPGP